MRGLARSPATSQPLAAPSVPPPPWSHRQACADKFNVDIGGCEVLDFLVRGEGLGLRLGRAAPSVSLRRLPSAAVSSALAGVHPSCCGLASE